MTRTRKGSKGPGWEPWSNKHEKEEQRADYIESPAHWSEDECMGCRFCFCVKCGSYMASFDDDLTRCIYCGHTESGDE